MKRSKFKLIMTAMALFIGLTLYSLAQEETGTLSGRVVNLSGNPVAEFPVFVASITVHGGDIWRVFLPHEYSKLRRAHTDSEGRFSIASIPPGPLQFGMLPYNIDDLLPSNLERILDSGTHTHGSNIFGMEQDDFESDLELLSLRIQGITFYPRNDFSPITFGIKPGTHIDNVVVKVQPRMRVRGRILFKDGTPLSNKRVRLHFRSYNVDKTGSGQSGGDPRTDADGYFIYYLDEKDDAAFYTFSVQYEDLVAEAGPIRLEPGERIDGPILTFDSEPPPQAKEVDTFTPPPERESREVWIVNPANGHAYKRVYCETRDDAIEQATNEKAHLVAINDAAEEAWLEAVFGPELCWIGLSKVEKEGQWQWDSGEPVTYENWLPDDFFSESASIGGRNYAVMTFVDGKWYAVGPDNIVWRMTRMTILEKADLLDNPSAEEQSIPARQ